MNWLIAGGVFKRSKSTFPLALKTDVLWPFHETGQVAFMVCHITADTETACLRWEQRVLNNGLGCLGRFLLTSLGFWHVYIDSFKFFRKSVSSSLQNVNNLCSVRMRGGVGASQASGPRVDGLDFPTSAMVNVCVH